jgi:hypothetical protein
MCYDTKGRVIGKNGDYHSRDYGGCCAGLTDVFSSSISYLHGGGSKFVWNFDILLNRLYVAPRKTAILINHSWDMGNFALQWNSIYPDSIGRRSILIRRKSGQSDFSLKTGYKAFWSGNQFSTNGCFSLHIYSRTNKTLGVRGGTVGWGTALQIGRSLVRFPMMSLEFFTDIILPASLWPWGWLSL